MITQENPPLTKERGFALVVTLSLLVLLTVIAVGMLSISSVALRTSSQGDALAEARANARLALAMALGQLQNEMGPDNRISAAHDAGDTPAGGQPHWVAVYDAWDEGESGRPEDPDSRGTPNFRSWLTSEASAGTSAQTVRLVDEGTLGSSASPDDFVTVPYVETLNGTKSGRIAWWTSDESQKAKVNAGLDDTPVRSFGDTSDAFLFAQSSPNVDPSTVPLLESFDWPETEGSRAKVITASSMDLAAGLEAGSFQESFHDATVHSRGMLTDVRAGRLKRDMSNLLTRDITEIEERPLYLADGRINRFEFDSDGGFSNESFVGSNTDTGNNQWGINLEELYLFHNIHQEVDWAGGTPKLVNRDTREGIVADRYHLYKRPLNSASQYLFALSAERRPFPARAPFRYTMQMNISAMVALWNPNDIELVYPPGMFMTVQLRNPPYDLFLEAPGRIPRTEHNPENFNNFQGHVGGGAGGTAAAGFTINPGEAKVFGTGVPGSAGNTSQLNLQEGFDPATNSVESNSWNLSRFFGTGSTEVRVNDSQPIDFEFRRIASPVGGNIWTTTNTWIGERQIRSPQRGFRQEEMTLSNGSLSDAIFPQTIRSSSAPRPISDYEAAPQPVLSLNYFYNVGQSDGTGVLPDAYPSRLLQLSEPAAAERIYSPNDYPKVAVNNTQLVLSAEPLNFSWTSIVAGSGQNIFHGGGRQPNPGVLSFVHRRIPLTPPLSFGAFDNAIACGFSTDYSEIPRADASGDNYPAGSNALNGRSHLPPLSSHSIGNSWAFPHLEAGEIAERGFTDHSWLVNNALWDPWFLSGIVAENDTNPWFNDPRSPEDQFLDFARGIKPLRNTRFVYTNFESPEAAAETLFSGGNLRPEALSLIARYLMVDGAFNVNSTSEVAWRAFLGSMQSQSLVTSNGTTQDFADSATPGTLGFAVNTSTSGTDAMWNGLSELSSGQLDTLAQSIVEEVRTRGPFLSISDFVNRRPDESGEAQVVGALQAAIDKSGINDAFTGAGNSLQTSDFAGFNGASSIGQESPGGRSIGAGAAGNLTQADILTALGTQITVRSDTFVIRAYGASTASSGGDVVASAWCEAVVQRLPNYVDESNTPEESIDWLTDSSAFSPTNETYGRKFRVVSFRWLNANEI